jgi:flagellar biosynthesis/type III secretory pathway protein FliH
VTPRRTRSTTVTVGWTDSRDDAEYQVECSVSPYVPERGPSYSSAGEPAEGPEVDLLAVYDEDGKERRDLLPEAERDRARIEEAAIEEAEESHAAAYEDACERRAEEAREERWGR